MPTAWNSFWRTVTRYQAEKVNPWIAARNAVGVVVPLAIGLLTGNLASAAVVATGSLNVSFSDGSDPYPVRAGRMLAASVVVAIAVCAGAFSGHDPVLAVVLATLWAFGAGLLVALSNAAPDLGVTSLVTMVVFASRSLSLRDAVLAGLLAFAGGLLQAFLALALWPVRRYVPERRVLGDLYLELSRAAASPSPSVMAAPAASAQSTLAHQTIAPLARDHSIDSERLQALLDQAERLRLGILTLARLQVRAKRQCDDVAPLAAVDRFFATMSAVLHTIGVALHAGEPVAASPELLRELRGLTEALRSKCDFEASLVDARHQMDAIAGQLRAAVDLAAYTSTDGQTAFQRRERRQPATLRLRGALAILGANLDLRSAAFRHAVRLAVCVGLGDALARSLGLERSYWMPMTIALVLKPDFTATFSRGVLRLAGTFTGLLLTSLLVHWLPHSLSWDIGAIGVLMFIVRAYGAANYGVLTSAVTALVVMLFAVAGIPPKDVILPRALNTFGGGAVALLAYAVWPTWERRRAPEALASMLDAYREYFRAVRTSYEQPDQSFQRELDNTRVLARLARSNLEASVDRLTAEPYAAKSIEMYSSVLASSHRLVHAMMSMEGGLASSRPVPARAGTTIFANHVELSLYYLAAALRGSPLKASDLPDLRDDHHALIESGDPLTERYALVNVETDRITNSLNTLSEQVLKLIE
ncbi:MAG: FUSC family protein [Bryobacteraceae bacterium]